MSEALSERVLADAIRENVGCDTLCADLCTCKIAAAVAHEWLVADRLALTTQIKALRVDPQDAGNPWTEREILRDQTLLEVLALPGLAPTSEQPE